jgi:hypothetical protein
VIHDTASEYLEPLTQHAMSHPRILDYNAVNASKLTKINPQLMKVIKNNDDNYYV